MGIGIHHFFIKKPLQGGLVIASLQSGMMEVIGFMKLKILKPML